MNRVILALGLTLAIATVAVLVRARAYPVPQSNAQTSQGSTPPHPLILQENDGEHLVRRTGPTGGWPFTIKLDGQNGNTQDFFVFASTMAPGQTIPFHKHDNAEEILFVEEGGATVIVGDQRALTGPRSIVFIPRDTWISATNSSNHDIHELAIFSRHGYEQYMRALGAKTRRTNDSS
jgi:quercetin dioxygenase-like cupin family protein